MALRFGKKVPTDAVNLAWVSVPTPLPESSVYTSNVADTLPANNYMIYDLPLATSIVTANVTYVASGDVSQVGAETGVVHTVHCPIRVKSPVVDSTGAWLLRITDGVVQQNIVLRAEELTSGSWVGSAAADYGWSAGDELIAIYCLQDMLFAPEGTDLTTWDGVSYQATVYKGAAATAIGNNRIQLTVTNILGISSLKKNGVELMVSEEDTISPGKDTSAVVKAINRSTGEVEVNFLVGADDNITVDVSFTATEYVYRGFYTPTSFVDLDLNPADGHTYSGGGQTKKLLNSVVYLYLLPSAVYSLTDAYSTGTIRVAKAVDYGQCSLLRWESGPMVTVPKETGSKTTAAKVGTYGQAVYDEYYFSSGLPEDFPGIPDGSSNIGSDLLAGGTGTLLAHPSALVLAKVYVSSIGTIDSVRVVDTRSRGGGLGENYVNELPQLTGAGLSEAQGYWDIAGWDGIPVMLNGIIVFEIPKRLLVVNGGSFTERQIEQIVDKHIPAGTKPIIRYV